MLRQNCCINNLTYQLNFQGCGNHNEGFLFIKTEDEVLMNVLKRKIDDTTLCDEQERQRAAGKYAFFTNPYVLAELERRRTQNIEILKLYGLPL